jgi:cytochrome c oxidase assembly factor 3
MSPALKRARQPFVVRNAITGTCIAAFAVGVWAYSISAVKQDNFDDIDAEATAAGLIKKEPSSS